MGAIPHRPPVSPVLGIAFGIVAVSTASLFIRFAQVEAPSLVIAALRLTLASLALAPLAFTRHRLELHSISRLELGFGLLSGIFLALHFATWITSLAFTTVASSVVFVSTAPLWVALLSPFTIKEPLTRPIIAGMALTLIGGAIVGLSDVCTLSAGVFICPPFAEFINGRALQGDLLALVGGMMAGAYLLVGRRLRRRTSLIPYVFIVYSMAAVVLIAIMLGARQSPFGFSPIIYLWIVLLALVPQLLGHSTFNWLLRYLPASYVSITLLGEPVGSVVLAYLLLRETPTLLKLFGAILILTGIIIGSREVAV